MHSRIYWLAVIVLAAIALTLIVHFLRIVNRPRYVDKHDIRTFPFKTGDLILTCTLAQKPADFFTTGSVVKFFTNSAYHHTAVAYVEPETGQLFFWEMNGSGTRLATLDDMRKLPNQVMVVRALNKPVDGAVFEEVVKRQWTQVFDQAMCLAWYHRYFFSYVPIPFLRGHQWGGGAQRTCVHMTTELYTELGVLDFESTGIDPTCIFAADYAKERINRKILPLANGYEFGPTTLLEWE